MLMTSVPSGQKSFFWAGIGVEKQEDQAEGLDEALTLLTNYIAAEGGYEMSIVGFALLCGMAGVVYSLITIYWVLKKDTGTPRMREINAAVLEGAMPS